MSEKFKIVFVLMVAVAVILGFSIKSHATLTTIGTASYGGSEYNLIYDDDLSITWLDYVHSPGDLAYQLSWAATLNGSGVLTYTLNAGVTTSWTEDWRLPTTVDGRRSMVITA